MSTAIPESKEEFEDSQWLSTYGMITASRILERYGIDLEHQDLLHSLKTSRTFFYKLIRLPLRNILNDVIRQQIYDYEVYAQKLFVDYLLSGETTRSDDSPGAHMREELETLRQELVALCREFREEEYKHFKLIADSQRYLIEHMKKWQQDFAASAEKLQKQGSQTTGKNTLLRIMFGVLSSVSLTAEAEEMGRVLDDLLKRHDFEPLSPELQNEIIDLCQKQAAQASSILSNVNKFSDQVSEIHDEMRHLRKQITAIIIKTNERMQVLPNYHIDKKQNEINKENLYFDTEIGE